MRPRIQKWLTKNVSSTHFIKNIESSITRFDTYENNYQSYVNSFTEQEKRNFFILKEITFKATGLNIVKKPFILTQRLMKIAKERNLYDIETFHILLKLAKEDYKNCSLVAELLASYVYSDHGEGFEEVCPLDLDHEFTEKSLHIE